MNVHLVVALGRDVRPLWVIQAMDSRLVERIGWTLLSSLWEFVAVALLLWIYQRAMALRPARDRYLASCAALLVMVLVSAATFATIQLPEWLAPGVFPQATALSAAATEELLVAAPVEAGVAAGQVQPETRRLVRQPVASESSQTADALRSAGTAPRTWRDRMVAIVEPWLATLVVIWLAGVVLLSARPVAGWWYVRRLRRDGTAAVSPSVKRLLEHAAERLGVRRAVDVVQSTLVAVPAVIGFFRPLVLLPVSVLTTLSPGELEAILAHEFAHIRRNDYLVNLLQTIVETLFFYHPAVWWVSHVIRQQREECCDDMAVVACGNSTIYATALVAVEKLRATGPAAAVAATGGSLSSRIRRLVGRREAVRHLRSDGPMNAAAVLAAALVIASSLSGRPRPHESADALLAAEKGSQARSATDETNRQDAGPAIVSLRLDGLKPAPKSIRVDLKLARKEFQLGESIVVDIELTNVGMEPVPYERGGFYPDLRLNDGFRMSAEKVDETGKSIGQPVERWPFPENHGGPVGGFTLKPDEDHASTLFVTRYLRFLEPGRYRLRIENVDRDQLAVYASGETFLTLKQPSLDEARGVYRAMKRAPRKAYDDNAMKFLGDAADFEAMHQAIYLPVLKEHAEEGDVDALSSLERMETVEANEALVAVLDRALKRDDWQLARACYRHLQQYLPFPNWYDEPLNDYDKGRRERVTRTWKPEFGPVMTRLARRQAVEVAARMRQRQTQPADADANDPVFMDLFQRGMFPEDHPQSLLKDIDYIYRCVGRPEDFSECLSAYAHSIELTKTLPLEKFQYFRPRGSASGFTHTVIRMIQRGAKPPERPAHPGEAAAFAIALHTQVAFRPAGWREELMKWLKHDSPYLAEVILGHLPQPVPEEVLEYLPTALASQAVDLQIAACHVARQHPRAAYRAPLQKILETASDEYLRKYAVDAARANGLKAKYDANAPFVTPEEAAADEPPKKNDDKIEQQKPDGMSRRAVRLRSNDREAALKLCGRWMLTLPGDAVSDVEVTQSPNGCLKLDGKKKSLVFGRYAILGDRVELVEHADPTVGDFVWQVESEITLRLIVDETRSGAVFLQAKMERIAAAPAPDQPNVSAKGAVFRLPEEIVQQARDLAAASLARRGMIKNRRPAGLGDVDSPQALSRAVAQAMRDLEPDGDWAATAPLKYLGDAAFDAVAAGTKSTNPLVAQWCCSVLRHRGAKAVPVLLTALKSTDTKVRRAAALALGQTFQPAAAPGLVAALEDPDASVRSSAMDALVHLRDRRGPGAARQADRRPRPGAFRPPEDSTHRRTAGLFRLVATRFAGTLAAL